MSGILLFDRLAHYESFGRGKPLIFLHGWLGSWRYWVPAMDEISTVGRAYALDLWGFGDSDKRLEHYSIDVHADMCAAFMDELGIDTAPLVGHTLGAAVALRLAERCPGRVEKIMAVGLPFSTDAIDRRLLAHGPNDVLARLFWRRQKPYPEVESGAAKTARDAIALTIRSVLQLDLRRVLQNLGVPLLTVYGERDTVIDAARAADLHAECRCAAARAIVLPGAAHFPMLDVTPRFNRLLRDFIAIASASDLAHLALKDEWRRRTH